MSTTGNGEKQSLAVRSINVPYVLRAKCKTHVIGKVSVNPEMMFWK